MMQCKGCGGEYEQTLKDGMRYFHVCPENEAIAPADRRDENVLSLEEGNKGQVRKEGKGTGLKGV